jgi:hypothetical protein
MKAKPKPARRSGKKTSPEEGPKPPTIQQLALDFAFVRRLVSVSRERVYEFSESHGCWKPCEKGYIEHLVNPILKTDTQIRYKHHLVKAIIDLIHVPEDKLKKANCLDGNGDILLNLKNGVLRIKADGSGRALEPFDPKAHFFTCNLNVMLDESAECPEYLESSGEILPDERDREAFEYYEAYALYPGWLFKKAAILHGQTNSGKSTLTYPLEVILNQEKDGLVTYFDLHDLADDKRYAIEPCREAMLNITPTSRGSTLRSSPICSCG